MTLENKVSSRYGAAVMLALAGVIVVLLGTVGWLAYDMLINSPASKQAATSTIADAGSPVIAQVGALGFEITIPDDIKDLTFYNSPDYSFTDVSSRTLTTLDANCMAEMYGYGDRANGTALGKFSSSMSKDVNTIAQLPHYGEGSPFVYIEFTKPTGSCASDPHVQQLLAKYRGELEQSFSSIKSIPLQ